MLHTAKNSARGAVGDGIWGLNTESALKNIKDYMMGDPSLKNFGDKIYITKGGTDEQADQNTTTLRKAMATAGYAKYDKYLMPSSRLFDRIPQSIQMNTLEEDPNGIPIKAETFKSLLVLKKYLEARGFKNVDLKPVKSKKINMNQDTWGGSREGEAPPVEKAPF